MQGPLKIVLVDDDQGVLRALGLVLQTLGHQTSLFTSGPEALTYLSQNPDVDIVVSDLRMPIMDGAELLRQVRQTYPAIPVVMMSGHATANDRASLVALGARGVLSKPFSPQELLALAEHEIRALEARGKVA
jgi:two-component system response regulator GlrR